MTGRTSLTIVLAAGEGTRMRSTMPKVLHPVAGQSLLAHLKFPVPEMRPPPRLAPGAPCAAFRGWRLPSSRPGTQPERGPGFAGPAEFPPLGKTREPVAPLPMPQPNFAAQSRRSRNQAPAPEQ